MRGEDIQWYEKYEAYKVEMRHRVKEDPAWKNVTLVEAPEFLHQAGQLRAFINSDICTTPNILSIEQDSYLVPDSIEWESLVLCLNEKPVSAIRMAIEPNGYPVGKEHLYRGEIFAHGVKLLYYHRTTFVMFYWPHGLLEVHSISIHNRTLQLGLGRRWFNYSPNAKK